LKTISNQGNSIFLIAKMDSKTVGYIAGGELEFFGQIRGVKEDAHFGVGDTAYIESLAVLSDYQGEGVAKYLMRAFLLRAKKKKFHYVSGHMRSGYAEK